MVSWYFNILLYLISILFSIFRPIFINEMGHYLLYVLMCVCAHACMCCLYQLLYQNCGKFI